MNKHKILVAFYSKAGENYGVGNVEIGNTEMMAQNIKEIVNGDLFKIEPIIPYPDNYEASTIVAKEELETQVRPEIKNLVPNFQDYDIVFIGYPNWWGTYPMIINTFMESYDFTSKIVIPFNTHEGSGSSNTYQEIRDKLSGAEVLEGLAISGRNAREDSSKEVIKKWVEGLKIN